MKRIFLIVCTLACLLLHLAPRSQAEIVDRIVATVNGQIILLSDWEDALRYEAFSNMRSLDGLSPADRKSVLDRLIDQELLREQLRAGDAEPASQEDVEKRVAEIRKQYPEAETELGWRALLDRYRLTEESIRNRVGVELELMRLVDARLRPSVSVDSKSIESYYNQELLPQLRQSG